jgi:DNA adenine methylase
MPAYIKNKKDIKTPLRYPGGKSKAIKFINPIIPGDFTEFREPFVGGGSVFIDAKQNINSNAVYKINDINFDLYCFWKHARDNCEELYNAVKNIKNISKDGKKLFAEYREEKNYSDFERAVRFFVMNRITFSGTVDSGGYSQQAFEKRFTHSSIEKLRDLPDLLNGVKIYNKDYTELIFADGDNVFIFLDLRTIHRRNQNYTETRAICIHLLIMRNLRII